MRYAPYQIRSSDLEDEWIKAKLARPIPCRAEDDNQESLFSDMAQSAPSCDFGGRVPARGVGFEGSEADRTRAHRTSAVAAGQFRGWSPANFG